MSISVVQLAQLFVPRLPFMHSRLTFIQFALISISFITLMWAFVVSDFSIALVAQHSHSAKPLIYKISGVWGNHEGSMLLFVLIHSFLGFLFTLKDKQYSGQLRDRTLGVHGAFTLALSAYILIASNPFESYMLPPLDGRGMNPMLQDPAMAIHPVMLYIGYVGYSMCFCFAVALLSFRDLPQNWAEELRFWAMLPWGFLTLGIALGSWWAYYELGWGGWWAWDPVENASLMPWLLGIALLHALAMARKKAGTYVIVSLVLALIPFAMSIFGTFIVRSGLITSVHAFAQDPERGLILICFFAIIVLLTSVYLFRRLKYFKSRKESIAFSLKEKLLCAHIIVFVAATLLVLGGTALPALISACGGPTFTLGPDFFNDTFVPILGVFLIVMPFGLALSWQDKAINYQRQLFLPLSLSLVLALLLTSGYGQLDLYVTFGVGLSLWLIGGTFLYLIQDESRGAISRIPVFLSHFGLGVSVLGMVVSTHWHLETTTLLKEGTRLEFAGYYLTLEKLREVTGPNYLSLVADLKVEKGGKVVSRLTPERRLYPVEQQSTHEVAIHTNLFADLYVVLGSEDPLKRGWGVKLHYYPLVPFIWIGALFMVLGAFWGLLLAMLRRRDAQNVI